MSSPLAIVSADKEIIELAREQGFNVVGFFDPLVSDEVLGVQSFGPDTEWRSARAHTQDLKVAIALDLPHTKRRVLEHYERTEIVALVSAHAHISPSATIGSGCVIQRHVSIMAQARLGALCKVNVGVTVHHDCIVGECCTLAPGARLLGRVHMASDVFIGAAATIMPGVQIGSGAYIGAGALVNRDVPPETTVVGVPAKPIRADKRADKHPSGIPAP